MNLFTNIPQVTKNILILNILFFVAKYVFASKGIDLDHLFGAHYPNSVLFKPLQIVTYFFMHGNFMHILFNMLMLISFGSNLERLWGPKRYFIFYVATALGAYIINSIIGTIEIYKLNEILVSSGANIDEINQFIIENPTKYVNNDLINFYIYNNNISMIGASGSIYGIMAAFAFLFPNTELMLMFPPMPIKAKYLIPALFVIEIYSNFRVVDNIAHLAHIGGGITGLIIVYFWKKNRNFFY
jgi:membrane associated rhomboid family serine protease